MQKIFIVSVAVVFLSTVCYSGGDGSEKSPGSEPQRSIESSKEVPRAMDQLDGNSTRCATDYSSGNKSCCRLCDRIRFADRGGILD